MKNLEFSFKTYLGEQDREIGDSFLYGEKLFILAEGIGGEYLSEVAKETACRVIYSTFFKYISENPSPGDALLYAIQQANIEIIKEREKIGKRMAASVSVVYINEKIMYFTHLGDTRIYLLSGSEINQLTRDHTILEEDPYSNREYGSPRLMHALTNGLGIHANPDINVKKYSLHVNDLVIMSTQGLTRRITDRDILWISQKKKRPQNLCDDLISLAKKKGGSSGGDISIGILRFARFSQEMRKIIGIYLVFFIIIAGLISGYILKYQRKDTGNNNKVTLSQELKNPNSGSEMDRKPPTIQVDIYENQTDNIEKLTVDGSQQVNETELFSIILDFLGEWKFAWEMSAGKKGDMDAYMSYYSNRFRTGSLDRDGWKKDKDNKNRKKDWIRIEISDIKILEDILNNKIEVRFFQDYKSSDYSSAGSKLLVLIKEDRDWKIIKEQSY